jgi:hypothetical protein
MDRKENDRPGRRLSDLIAAGLMLPPCTAVPVPSPVPLPSTGVRRHRDRDSIDDGLGRT